MNNHEVTDFSRDVIERSKTVPVLVDFWAEWCGPCKVLGPVLERLEQTSGGQWVLAKVDTDRNQELAARYGIRGIPNVKLFVDGDVANEFTGALPERMVREWLDKAIPSKSRQALKEARERLSAGDGAGAQNILEEIARKDSGNTEARVLLSRAIVASEPGRASELVAGMEEDSEWFPDVDAVRTFAEMARKLHDATLPEDPVRPLYTEAIAAMISGHYETALARFIEVIRWNRPYDDDGSRRACIAIFHFLGQDHEITGKYRRDFSGALNV
jgi:putative thioredoxin